MTALFFADWKGYDGGKTCPAVVVRPSWVLTANHCVDVWDRDFGPTTPHMLPSLVLFGNGPVSKLEVEEVHRFWKGPEGVAYPDWEGSDQHLWEFYGDAALVKVKGSFSDVFEPDPTHPDKPGCYMGPKMYAGPAAALVGKQVLCIGAGGSPHVHIFDAKTSRLTYAYLPVVSEWKDKGVAVGEGKNADGDPTYVTYGDSGGPCYLQHSDGTLELVGIASDLLELTSSGSTDPPDVGYQGAWTFNDWMTGILPPTSDQLPGTPRLESITYLSSSGLLAYHHRYRVTFSPGENAKWHRVQYQLVGSASEAQTTAWFTGNTVELDLFPDKEYRMTVAAKSHCAIFESNELSFIAQEGNNSFEPTKEGSTSSRSGRNCCTSTPVSTTFGSWLCVVLLTPRRRAHRVRRPRDST